MNINKLYTLVENLECSITNNLDTTKDSDNLINYILMNHIKNPLKRLLLDKMVMFADELLEGKENHTNVVIAANKLTNLVVKIIDNKEFDYNLLKKHNIESDNNLDEYIKLEELIKKIIK